VVNLDKLILEMMCFWQEMHL